ncbi:hypothetical protein TrLO_g5565 [Triparma laevis f. longispina]|uniref:Uncharacterized protein n=1 Tax=Triparma laevis f. longispina TaxID=1714387 RepID=A0A9W7AHY7_9STRA|nr:hypothetical protein TrLO_g5565 [Triparma laevis f. longispina]
MNYQSHVAELTDEDLSYFLTNDVVIGVIVGLGQLAFLMFASIQCNNANDDWRQRNRTLINQAGLSGMVTLYGLVKLASGVVPQHILEKHMVSMKKVVAMRMNAEESAQAFGLATAVGCALFSVGCYGAEGDFYSDAKKYAAFTVPSMGGSSLLVTAAFKLKNIRGEMKRGEEDFEELRQGESSSSSSEDKLTEASSFWVYLGGFATMLESALFVAKSVTLDELYFIMAGVALSIVLLAYGVSIFCQPRRNSPKDLWKLRLHFASFAYVSQTTYMVDAFRNDNLMLAGLHLSIAVVFTVLFYLGLKLRANIGRLPDVDLEAFLIDTLFKGRLKTLVSILFILFRTTKCVIEEGDLAECYDISWCATAIYISS